MCYTGDMIISVDTGGTKTLIAAFSLQGDLQHHITFPTPKAIDDYFHAVASHIRELQQDSTLQAISVAMPGIVQDGVAVSCPNLGWRNVPVIKLLKKQFSHTPIYLENDANLGGLGEAHLQTRTHEPLLYVTVSTGIGTGFITNGAIDERLRHSEGGHIVLPYEGILQPWESFASGRAIAAHYQALSSDIHNKEEWRAIAERLSLGLLTIIPLASPRTIIFGGSVGAQFDRFASPLRAQLVQHLPDYLPLPELRAATEPHHAVAYGGFYYATQQLTRR